MSILFYIPDDQIVALCAYGEARSEGAEGMMAVINVITNRVLHPEKDRSFMDNAIYASTGSPWKAVVLAPYQFSIFNPVLNGMTNQYRIKLEEMAANFERYLATDNILMTAYNLAQLAITGQLQDNTGGATHYYNPAAANPSWARTIPVIGSIGQHVFHSILSAEEKVRQFSAQVFDETKAIIMSPMTWVVVGGLLAATFMYIKRRK